MRLLQAGAHIYYDPQILVEHLHAPSGGQRDKGKSLNVALEKQKLYFYFYRKHFSVIVLKQQLYLGIIEGVKKIFLKGNLVHLLNIIKGYRLSNYKDN